MNKVHLLLFATAYNTIMKRANNGVAKQSTLFGMWGKKKSKGSDDS